MIGGRRVRVAMVGGGSGGHITPIMAVAYQLKQLDPEVTIDYIGQTGDSLADVPARDPNIDTVHSVRAGKLRRYHGEGIAQLFDFPTVAKNIRDMAYVAIGFCQSLVLLRRLRPDVIFVKGGFVGVPVGLAAAILRIPFVTHDSDAIPGLANRIISRWAAVHAVALPAEIYAYPAASTVSVGVPVSHEFRQRTTDELAAIRQELSLRPSQRVLLVTGGGLGAQRLNDAVVAMSPDLLRRYPELGIVHLAGRSQSRQVEEQYDTILSPDYRERVEVIGFTDELYKFSAVAEAVITRAGGNSIAEFAAQAKPCVVVPNPILAGGHQTKNAKVLADRKAALLVEETDIAIQPKAILPAIRKILDDPEYAAGLSQSLQTVAKPDAARRLAMILLEQVHHTNTAKEKDSNDVQPQTTRPR